MVYFLKYKNLIKIGYTKDLNNRLNTLYNQFEGSFLIKAIDGDRYVEKTLHEKFKNIRTKGEWFEETEELSNYIKILTSTEQKIQTFFHNKIEKEIGEAIKSIRLRKNLTRESVCNQAGVSINALRHLENGTGATLVSLIRVLRTLGRLEWFSTLNPVATINPLNMVKNKQRQRASKKRN